MQQRATPRLPATAARPVPSTLALERLAIILPVAGGDAAQIAEHLTTLIDQAQALRWSCTFWLVDPQLDTHLEGLSALVQHHPDLVRLVPRPAQGGVGETLRQGLVAAVQHDVTMIAVLDLSMGATLDDLAVATLAPPTTPVIAGYRAPTAPSGWYSAASRLLFGVRVPPGIPGFILIRAADLAPRLARLSPAEMGLDLLRGLRRIGLAVSVVTAPDPAPLVSDAPSRVSDLLRLHDHLARNAMPERPAVPEHGWRARLLRPRSARIYLAGLSAIVLVSLLLHLQLILTTKGAFYDIESFAIQADTVLNHQNVYLATSRYPYPPVWIWIVAAMRLLSNSTGLAFVHAVKIPATLGDLGIVVLMAQYLRQRVGPCFLALIPAAIFAWNPVTLFITAGHGQFDGLVLGCILLGLVLRGPRQDQRVMLAALAVGLAIALKGYPALVLPYFIITAPYGKKILTAVVACLPIVASMALYSVIFGYTPGMITHVIDYGSTGDFGWHFILSGTGTFDQLAINARYAIIVVAAVVPGFVLGRRPAAAVAFTFAAFYALTFDMSVQYLLWILPFLALSYPLWSLVYSLAAAAAATSFYVHVFPKALPLAGRIGHLLRWFDPYRLPTTIAVTATAMVVALFILASSAPGFRRATRWLRVLDSEA